MCTVLPAVGITIHVKCTVPPTTRVCTACEVYSTSGCEGIPLVHYFCVMCTVPPTGRIITHVICIVPPVVRVCTACEVYCTSCCEGTGMYLLRGYVLLPMCTVPPAARCVLLPMCTVPPAARVFTAYDVYGTSCCEGMYC